ncbi:MAG TPA: hypothetical protein VMW69_17000 [Spirochaetia bacterium]|nr:hypothetical protein [Spirochaetia bacterium]
MSQRAGARSGPTLQRAKLTVRLSPSIVDQMRDYVHTNRAQGWTQDQFVESAIHAYLRESPPDEVLYRRLDRMQINQEKINNRLQMMGQLFLEYMFYWFRLWPDIPSERKLQSRRTATENLVKWLLSLKRSVVAHDSGSPVLSEESLVAYLKTLQQKRNMNEPSF